MTLTQKKAWSQMRLHDFKLKREEQHIHYVGMWILAILSVAAVVLLLAILLARY